jgi:hypothetical protein
MPNYQLFTPMLTTQHCAKEDSVGHGGVGVSPGTRGIFSFVLCVVISD